MRELAEKAWNALKAKDDPEFSASAPDHQRILTDAAADVVKTGVTINDFERKVLELHKEAQKDEPRTPLGTSEPATALGTTNAIGEEPPKAAKAETKAAKAEAKVEDKAEAEEEPLASKSRAELDELAVEKGLNPEDYKNKAELIAALEK